MTDDDRNEMNATIKAHLAKHAPTAGVGLAAGVSGALVMGAMAPDAPSTSTLAPIVAPAPAREVSLETPDAGAGEPESVMITGVDEYHLATRKLLDGRDHTTDVLSAQIAGGKTGTARVSIPLGARSKVIEPLTPGFAVEDAKHEDRPSKTAWNGGRTVLTFTVRNRTSKSAQWNALVSYEVP